MSRRRQQTRQSVAVVAKLSEATTTTTTAPIAAATPSSVRELMATEAEYVRAMSDLGEEVLGSLLGQWFPSNEQFEALERLQVCWSRSGGGEACVAMVTPLVCHAVPSIAQFPLSPVPPSFIHPMFHRVCPLVAGKPFRCGCHQRALPDRAGHGVMRR